ncbi:MAG: integrase, partial [Sphingobacteriales bacterium]
MSVDHFLTYLLHEKRYSPHTIHSYEGDLLQFRDFMLVTFNTELEDAVHTHVRDFMVWLMEQGNSASSVGRKLSTLRTFFKYLIREEKVRVNPMAFVKAPKIPKRLPVFVDDHKMDQLLDSKEFFDDTFRSVRDKLVIETLFGTGVRLAELLSIKESDIDFYEQSIRILGKRMKERVVPITKPLANLLKEYIDLKSLQKFNNKTEVLFVTNKGAAASRGLIGKIVNRYLTYISTQDKRSPHVLRHSYATA